MLKEPVIQLICRTSESRTVIVYENLQMDVINESFLSFVERFCNTHGTSIANNQQLQNKHFRYHKNVPLYIASRNHLTLVPSHSLHNEAGFLYNGHQILRMEESDGSTLVTFVDGTQYELGIGLRSFKSQMERAITVRSFYQQSAKKVLGVKQHE